MKYTPTLARLIDSLRPLGRVIVAFSGGADSAYLAWAARQALGDGALAVTADSPSFPRSHKRDAEAFTAKYGTTVDAIKQANSLTSDALSIGQQLIIP